MIKRLFDSWRYRKHKCIIVMLCVCAGCINDLTLQQIDPDYVGEYRMKVDTYTGSNKRFAGQGCTTFSHHGP